MYRLSPSIIPKFTTPIRRLDSFVPSLKVRNNRITYNYKIESREVFQQMLPVEFEQTRVWGFGGLCYDTISNQKKYCISTPGPLFKVQRNIEASIKWINNLKFPYMFPVDPTLLWANPKDFPRKFSYKSYPFGDYKAQAPVPMVIHLHGAQVPPIYDGHPDAWYTANNLRGPMYVTNTYKYQNMQEPSTILYSDNTRGLSRLNVYSGLLGAYIITDSRRVIPEMIKDFTLIIQDKSFYEDASLYYPVESEDDNLHPYWVSEFYGDVLLVNGISWPYMDVERELYRFRLINGSNCRRYEIRLSDSNEITQIATDGGYIDSPINLNSFELSPGERIEIIIDFRNYEHGDIIFLKNGQSNAQNSSTDTIMQFRIINTSKKSANLSPLGKLNNIKKLSPDVGGRISTINQNTAIYIDGQPNLNPANYFNRIGSTSIWDFVNLTDKDEVIHLHLIQFQIVFRQTIDTKSYLVLWKEINGEIPLDRPTKYLDVTSFVTRDMIKPKEYENGWKDTVYLPKGCVTRIIVRYAPTYTNQVAPGENTFPFNPTVGGEYSINSSVLEHSDNEASRPQFIIY